MKDLCLWRLLEQPELDEAAVTPLLEELLGLPLAQRAPFLGKCLRALSHPDARLRAAAIGVIAGADGQPALRRLCDSLSDPAPAARNAAVEALRASCEGHPDRWAHAVFHADPDVRLAAITGPGPAQAEHLVFYLLADPACRDRVLARIAGAGERITLPAQILPAVLEFAARGVIPREEARRWIAGMSWNEAASWLQSGRRRAPEQVDVALPSAQSPSAARSTPPALTLGEDALDALFDLLWDAGPDDRAGQTLLHQLSNTLPSWPADLARRAAVAILAVAAHRGWDEARSPGAAGAAGLCVMLHPPFVGFAWVPPAVRRASVGAIYDAGDRAPRLEDAEIKALILEADICRRASSGSLDLWVVGGLLHLVRAHPYRLLREWVGVEAVVLAFAEDTEGSVPFLGLKDDSKRGREDTLDRICAESPCERGVLLARLALTRGDSGLDGLSALDPSEGAAVLLALVGKSALAELPMAAKRAARIAQVLAPKLTPGAALACLRAWLDRRSPESHPLGLALLGAIAMALTADDFVEAARSLAEPELARLLEAISYCVTFPHGKELALAHALAGHDAASARAWAAPRIPSSPSSAASPPIERPESAASSRALPPRLPEAVLRTIATVPEADLAAALRHCLVAPTSGLCEALAERPAPSSPSMAACLAILGCHDPLVAVDRELRRFGSEAPAFLTGLDRAMVKTWERELDLPLLAHAWIHRWERHADAAVAALYDRFGGLAAGLEATSRLTCAVLREQVWDAVTSALGMWRWRDRARLAAAATPELAATLVGGLDGDVGAAAARALCTLHDSGVAAAALEPVRARVSSMLPDLSDATRAALARWIESRGLPSCAPYRRRPAAPIDDVMVARIGASNDLDALEQWCRGADARIVADAALRLLDLGEPGLDRLVRVLHAASSSWQAEGRRTSAAAPCAVPEIVSLVESVTLWPEGPALERARALAAADDAPPELRFRVHLAILDRALGAGGRADYPGNGGARARLDDALAVVCLEPPRPSGAGPSVGAPAPASVDPWFRPEDYDRLIHAGVTLGPPRGSARGVVEIMIARRLAPSPQPHAYRRAVEHLITDPVATTNSMAAVVAFLDAGTDRLAELRRRAARWLFALGEEAVFPILLAEALERSSSDQDLSVLADQDPALVEDVVTSLLVAGPRVAPESTVLELVEAEGVHADARAAAYERLLAEVQSDKVRAALVLRVEHGKHRPLKLRRVAEVFAWGVTTGRQLTGRVFKFEMIGGQGLGYTRFTANRIFVTPLPILRMQTHGQAIVEGLILHELGHHLFHRGPEPEAVWRAAEKEKMFGLLNLVADEHLERNLRGVDARYGDRLKRLAAYAFQHADKEVPVPELLGALQGRSFEVLHATQLDVARRDGCVAVQSGALLLAMEQAGMSFPRFVRALRMGLGNRHGDPDVEAALALFRRGFRQSPMSELYAIAQKLRAIFGWQTQLCETFGPHESLPAGVSEQIEHGEGITPEELDREIDRVLDPRTHGAGRGGSGGGGSGAGGRRWINIGTADRFETIPTVVKIDFDPAEHARYAAQVMRHARRMRRWLEELGLRLEPQSRRVRGRRVDPTRTRALVLRGDPRILIARELSRRSDLFLGVLIDCSGSMQTRDHIGRAKLFGAMLSEAARGLPSVDLRVYGYTDKVIYDAGDATHCAAHGLPVGGGNNDAAALWHASLAARASARKAKLLVMISDGLPTECSAAALRGLVASLGRRSRICCAQVAVQPLEEVCFPHYVVLEDGNQDAAVRKFGGIVARLVQRAISG